MAALQNQPQKREASSTFVTWARSTATRLREISQQIPVGTPAGRTSVNTPFGVAHAAAPVPITPPRNGKCYTPNELADPGIFPRSVLSRVLAQLGGDPMGKVPTAMRTEILLLQA